MALSGFHPKNLYQQIISSANFQKAYLYLASKLYENSLAGKYHGLDGVNLPSTFTNSCKLITTARQELIDQLPIGLTQDKQIPKKTKGKRTIYIYSIRDRIKAQALYRLIEPVFETHYSPYLFSYRSTKPSYYAIKTVVRHYHRFYGQTNILVLDLSQYTEYVDHQILISKIKKIITDKPTVKFLSLFIKAKVFKKDQSKKTFGLVLGVPLMGLFANLYLNDLDKQIGQQVDLYRRCGDDIIIFNKDLAKLKNIRQQITTHLTDLKLVLNPDKCKLINSTQPFKYLGYYFDQNQIGLPAYTYRKVISTWKSFLPSPNLPKDQKIKTIRYYLSNPRNKFHFHFLEFLKQYSLINNYSQIKRLSDTLPRLITKNIFRSYSPRLHRLTLALFTPLSIPSLFSYYIKIHHGRQSLADLSLKGNQSPKKKL